MGLLDNLFNMQALGDNGLLNKPIDFSGFSNRLDNVASDPLFNLGVGILSSPRNIGAGMAVGLKNMHEGANAEAKRKLVEAQLAKMNKPQQHFFTNAQGQLAVVNPDNPMSGAQVIPGQPERPKLQQIEMNGLKYQQDPTTGALSLIPGQQTPQHPQLVTTHTADGRLQQQWMVPGQTAGTPVGDPYADKSVQPSLTEVPVAGDKMQKQWLMPGQTAGTPVGEPYTPKGVVNPDTLLSDEAINAMVERRLAGDKTVLTNIGRGAQGAANVARFNEALAKRGLSPEAIINADIAAGGRMAGERTLSTQESNAAAAGTEALGALDIARQASAKVPRTNFVPVNQAIQAWQSGTSDPNLAAFGRAIATVANTYARAVNPKGLPHQAVVEETLKGLSKAQGPDALNAMLDIMQQEIQMAQKSPGKARQIMEEGRTGKEPGKSGVSFPSWSVVE